MVRILVWLIERYQWLSRRMPAVCRFQPSCSQYAREALLTHGLVRGSLLSAWRILRCNPLCPGGEDPVPPRRTRTLGPTHNSDNETTSQ